MATDNSFLTPGNQAWELPSYGLMDIGFNYTFDFGGTSLTALVNVNNLFDKEYISESETNRLYNPENPDDVEIGKNGSINNIAYFGFGRTWNAGLKLTF